MAKLPSEQDIGDLPANLPRRMGVGSWQPGDIARGAESIARGGQSMATSLAQMAGDDIRQTNEAETAKANSLATVGYIDNAQKITNSTDPNEVASLRQNYPVIAESAANNISDPDARAKFLITHAPEVARFQVGADTHATGLVKNQALADFDTTSSSLINAAVNTDDEDSRAASLNAIKASGQSLVSRGILTPDEWARKAPQITQDYVKARFDTELARADRTGDYSRLKELSKLFNFDGTSWGTAGGQSAPADTTANKIATSYGTTIKDTAAKYGVSPSFLSKTIYIESGGNAAADNGFARGLTQFSDATAAKYGVNQKDSTSSIDGAARYAVDNRAELAKTLGRPPTEAELYLAHQQGGGGAAKLLANPNARAGDIVGDAAIRNNGGDPDAPAKQFTGMWKAKYDATPDAFGGGAAAGAPAAGGGGAPARAIGDSLARGVGGQTGVMNAATSMTPEQVLDVIRGNDVTTTHNGPDGKPVKETAKGLTDDDLKAGPIVLSSGASNAPADASLLKAQLVGLRARNVDLSRVTVMGVGTRDDFKAAGVNDTLQAIAKQYGAKFQPLDPGMVGPDGVHLTPAGYKSVAGAAGGGGAGAGAPAAGSPFVGVVNPGAEGANPHLMPPQSEWPADARGVEHNADGSLSYIMSEGNKLPVPGSRASGAAGASAPGGTGTLLDALKPQERAEMGLRIQTAISTGERRAQAADDQYTKAAVSDLEGRIKVMTSGRPIADSEWKTLAPYADSPIPAVRLAYANADAIRNNLARYQGASPAQVQADVEAKSANYNEMRARYPNSEAVNTLGVILQSAQEFAKSYQTDAVKHPIERAITAGFLPNGTSAIDPNDPNIEASIARRVSDAKTAAGALKVEPRFLQESERPMLKQIAMRGGDEMVDMAKHIVEGAGPDAPQIFKEIGVDAPMFHKIGELAASGGDPEAIRDIASIIKAQGDKAARADLPTFSEKSLSKFTDPLTSAASRFGPDFSGRTRAAANMLMSADAIKNGYDPKIDPTLSNWKQQDFDRAYNLALGGSYGPDKTQYGGLADRNARNWTGAANPVIVPNTMKANDFPDIVNSITDADLRQLPNQPVGKNGVPISAGQIAGGSMEAVPDKDGIFRGKYLVFTDGKRADDNMVRDVSGKPWVLDLQDPNLDAALRGKHPTSYLTPPPIAPAAPGRYRDTPGVIALGSEAETQ